MGNFYGCPREPTLNCEPGSHEKSILRDVFIAKMHNGEIQRELLKQIRNPKKALELAINEEMAYKTILNFRGPLLIQYLIKWKTPQLTVFRNRGKIKPFVNKPPPKLPSTRKNLQKIVASQNILRSFVAYQRSL